MKGGTRKRGSTWSYYFDLGTIGGKRQKRERGGYRTRKEAQAALAAAVAQYNRAGMPFSPKDITIADYLDQWLKEYVNVNLKFSTQISYAQAIQYHLKPRFGSYRLASLTTAAVQQYANDLKRDGYAKSTLVDIISVLSGALSYAVEPLQYIQANPCEHVRIPKYENGRQEMHHFLTADDMQRVLERFPEGTPFYVPIMIGYCCGLRIRKAELVRPEIPESTIRAWLESFRSGDKDDPAFCQKLVQTFVAQVVVTPEHVVIFYNIEKEPYPKSSDTAPRLDLAERYPNFSGPVVIDGYIMLRVAV